eukprot:4852757-Pleurochrysis_carterae.AAC.4
MVKDKQTGRAYLQILAHALVHADLAQVAGVIGQDNANGVLATLALQEDGITTEELQFLHSLHIKRDDRVVIVGGLVDDEPVRVLLLHWWLGLFRHGFCATIASSCGSLQPEDTSSCARPDATCATFAAAPKRRPGSLTEGA